MPGRTQSPRASGKRSSAAELASERWLRLERLDQLVEPVELRLDAARAVGVGEVRHQREPLHLRVHAQRVVRRAQALDAEAEAVHAAVHLEIDVDLAARAWLRFSISTCSGLWITGVSAYLVQRREVGRLEEALEHQDRLGHAGDAQPRRFLEIEHREAVGGAERARRALHAVAVRVRLDHRPDLRARRRGAALLSNYVRVPTAEMVARIGRGMAGYCAIKRRGAKRQERICRRGQGSRLNYGFYIIMAAQFFSSLADNALLVAAIALLIQAEAPSWLTPYLKFFFVISYVALAPFVGAFADRLPKGQVMLARQHHQDRRLPDDAVRASIRCSPTPSSAWARRRTRRRSTASSPNTCRTGSWWWRTAGSKASPWPRSSSAPCSAAC